MDVSAIGAVNTAASRAVHGNQGEQAQVFAAESRVDQVHAKNVEQKVDQSQATATAPTSQAYSPALLAQAAQFGIYTQAGVLANLAGAHPVEQPSKLAATANTVAPVANVSGNKVDTRA